MKLAAMFSAIMASTNAVAVSAVLKSGAPPCACKPQPPRLSGKFDHLSGLHVSYTISGARCMQV